MKEPKRNNPDSEKKFPSRPIAPLGVIAMNGCQEMGNQINHYLMGWHDQDRLQSLYGNEKEDFLIQTDCKRLETGEGTGLIKETIRGYDLYILCDIGAWQCVYRVHGMDVPMMPDDHYADLKRLISAASGKAHRINVIMPLLYGGLQSERNGRESLDCALMLQELQKMGVSNIITFDVHDPGVANSIPVGGLENFMPAYQMIKELFAIYPDISLDHLMIASPNARAMNRNIYYSSILGVNMGLFYRRMNHDSPYRTLHFLGEQVEGMDIFAADDIILSGDEFCEIAVDLKRRGARRVFLAATYALFTQGTEQFDALYEKGIIDRVFVTNLTYTPQDILDKPWIRQVDMSKYLAIIIETLNHNQSLANLFDHSQRIGRLIKRRESRE